MYIYAIPRPRRSPKARTARLVPGSQARSAAARRTMESLRDIEHAAQSAWALVDRLPGKSLRPSTPNALADRTLTSAGEIIARYARVSHQNARRIEHPRQD